METQVQNAQVVDLNKEPVLNNNLAYKEQLKQLPEVQNLTGLININDTNTIISFGQEPSVKISQVSDSLLSSMKSVKSEEVSEMLISLTKIMDKFDIKEIEDPEKAVSFFNRFKSKLMSQVNKIFEKYEDMGKEVDEIVKILIKYKSDINKANEDLKKQFDANVEFFKQLEKYVVAGELGLEEIENYKNSISNSVNISDDEKQMKIQQLDMMKEMLSQRIYDLQIAENVAMQTCPMIRTMQMSNFNLLRKIESSFIITLPIFKQCLIQAVQLKRQEIQAKAIKQLDDKTNELLERNARNTATQSVAIANMASGSSIQIDTLKNNFEVIKKGIEDTQAIYEENARKREQDSSQLEDMKHEMKEKGFLN